MMTTFVLSANCWGLGAENSDENRISLNVVLPANSGIPSEAEQLLETRLIQIVTRHGIADNGLSERFVITAKCNTIQKDITQTNPPRISLKLEVTLMVGDVVENKIYETASITVSGIGTNETKAYIQAFQNIRADNRIFGEMIEKAKVKIIQYYKTNCEQYLSKAKTLQSEQKFDNAIYTLMQIPSVCSECYNIAQNLATDITSRKINFQAASLLNQAKAQWAGAQNISSATATLAILGRINAVADNQPQVQNLIGDINAKLRADEKEQWEFKMKQYEDAKAREQRDFEFMVKRQSDNHQLSQQRIEAFRHVAGEFARNMPREINFKNKISLW